MKYDAIAQVPNGGWTPGVAVVKPIVVFAVLEQKRDPFTFELRCAFERTYNDFPEQWADLFSRGDE